MIRLQEGKYYRTRDGRKVGPLDAYMEGYFHLDDTGDLWREDGTEVCSSECDIIAEWVDDPTTNASAQVDNLRDEYRPVVPVAEQPAPKFKVGDRVGVKHSGNTGTIISAPGEQFLDEPSYYVNFDWYDDRTTAVTIYESELEPLVASTNDNSPIRTRRVIVPGTYGDVTIEDVYGDCVAIDFSDFTGDARSLREAAHLFNQIAEVLEEQAGQANAA